MQLSGLPASPGYAIGKACTLRQFSPEAAPRQIAPEQVASEGERFRAARAACVERLAALRGDSERQGRTAEAAILDAHSELLLDEELERDVTAKIAAALVPAERAVAGVLDEIVAEMSELESEYARDRAQDLLDLKELLVRALAGATPGAAFTEPAVLVGRDLTPADTAALDKELLLGVVSETGGRTSHVSLIAHSLGIPAVVGVPHATAAIRDGDPVVVDGCAGTVLVHPTREQIAHYRARQTAFAAEQQLLEELRDLPAVTRDGREIRLAANIASADEAALAIHCGASGIGLLRTEFLFLNRASVPSEEEQFRAYRQVAAALQGHCVCIRTLDVGGDKPLPYLPLPPEANPFLGRRAVRLYAAWPDLIRTQLRAILRASHFGTVHLLVPMIISPEELIGLRTWLAEIQDELRLAGIPFDPALPVGCMIETPAAAVIADRLIEHVDFFSVGANDLTQYTLAVDRGHEQLAELYDPLHPAVLRLIHMAVDASHAAGKWTGVCGEIAGDALATELLLGLGVDELSMSPRRIAGVKQSLRNSSLAAAQTLAGRALAAGTAREVRMLAASSVPTSETGGN